MLYIRADGNAEIGVGHMMRCLSIADRAVKRGMEVTFVLADGQAEALVRERGYAVLVLGTDYRNMEQELPLLCQKCGSQYSPQCGSQRNPHGTANLLLVDSYQVTERYLRTLREVVFTAYMDDFGGRRLCADLLINYNIYARQSDYDALYAGAEEKPALLSGSRYAPLREQFRRVSYEVRQQVKRILILTGGTDGRAVNGQAKADSSGECHCVADDSGADHGIAWKIADRLLALPQEVELHLVSGPFHASGEELRQLAAEHTRLILHENVTEMAALMASCDIAVSAAGSTLYELCAVGVPGVYYSFVDNQQLPARYFEEATKMRNAGNFAVREEETLQGIVREIAVMLRDVQYRREVSESMKAVTDGNGAERIAEKLQSYMEKQSKTLAGPADK